MDINLPKAEALLDALQRARGRPPDEAFEIIRQPRRACKELLNQTELSQAAYGECDVDVSAVANLLHLGKQPSAEQWKKALDTTRSWRDVLR